MDFVDCYGKYITKEDIERGVKENRVLVYYTYALPGIRNCLLIFEDVNEADEYVTDTRGDYYSVCEEAWTNRHPTIEEALEAAKVK